MPQIKPVDEGHPLIGHMVELRVRLMRTILCLLLIVAALLPFSEYLYTLVATPLLERLPLGSGMIATEVASPFLAPFKLTLFLAFFISMPYGLYQVWTFIVPGLYRNEKHIALPLLVTSIVLFYGGIAFAHFLVLPSLFSFFISIAPTGVSVMTDISRYLDFILKLYFAFSMAFEVPIVTLVFIWTGLVSADSLRNKRPYVIIAAFVIGALLTPPDIISQSLLAVPVWLLFEVGLLFARFLPVRKEGTEKKS